MPWSKEMQESYALQQKIRRHMIDCVVCEWLLLKKSMMKITEDVIIVIK